MFTLAHLSDPHLGSLPTPTPAELFGKRVLGYVGWRLRRQAIHDGPVLAALVADLRNAGADHVAITGDLTNISLPREFDRAERWLRDLGDPRSVTVVPGNHDAYVPVPWGLSLAKWAPFMSGTTNGMADDGGAERPVASTGDFPFVRRRGPTALVGVSTAEPSSPISAAGYVGPGQLQALERRLTELGRQRAFRIVLIHHPPLPGRAARRKQLSDGPAFRAVIARAGAELVLHGHTHRSGLAKLPTPRGHAPVIGVPSASARPHRGRTHARYHLYHIEAADGGWRVQVEVRGVEPTLDRFSTEARFSLSIQA